VAGARDLLFPMCHIISSRRGSTAPRSAHSHKREEFDEVTLSSVPPLASIGFELVRGKFHSLRFHARKSAGCLVDAGFSPPARLRPPPLSVDAQALGLG